MGAGAAIVSFALYVCARAAVAEVWAADRATGWPDAGACAGKSVGAALGRQFPHSRPARKQQRLRSERIAPGPEARRQGYGEIRRGFLQVARLRAPAANFLGAVVIY